MSVVDIQSLRALVEFQEYLRALSAAAAEEIQGMIGSADRIVQGREQLLQDRRDALWTAEKERRDCEEAKQDTGVEAIVEHARIEVARAEADCFEMQAAYMSLRDSVDDLRNELILQVFNAQEFLEGRIQAAGHYRALSVSVAAGEVASRATTDMGGVPGRSGGADATRKTSSGHGSPAGSVLRESLASILPDSENEGRDSFTGSPLRGSSVAALPRLPNGLEWVPIESFRWSGDDGASPGLKFTRATKEQMQEMLKTFESELLPMLSRNADVSEGELSKIDQENNRGGTSSSLLLCHVSTVGWGDPIAFSLKHASVGDEHPAAGTRSFKEGKKARALGQDASANPYRRVAGREGMAGVWDQGWRLEDERKLSFESGRHRALVARELGWKFIPARVVRGESGK